MGSCSNQTAIFRALTQGLNLKAPAPKEKKYVESDITVSKNKFKKMSKDTSTETAKEMVRLRLQMGIKTKGYDLPNLITEFEQLKTKYSLSDKVLENLKKQGYTVPTAVQMQCWPIMMESRDLIAYAPTGSGKTAGFLLPIIHCLKRPRALGFRAVVVSHTRELAEQTYRECKVLTENTGLKVHLIDRTKNIERLFGPKTSQKFDILITTPNRLVNILQSPKPIIALKHVEWLIVDECDRLFEGGKRGFRDQLSVIYQACSGPKIHRGFFSATRDSELDKWCDVNLTNMATVSVGTNNTGVGSVSQELLFCGDEDTGKILGLKDILQQGYEPPCLIFVQTKDRAKQLFKELVHLDILVDAIHADCTAKQREDCVAAFREKKIWVLICTEMMARGIDFKGVNLVINYDMPSSVTAYVHCIGRTGRAGRQGRAITFWTNEDKNMLGGVARNIKHSGGSVPDWMTKIKHESAKSQRRNRVPKEYVSRNAKLERLDEIKNKLAETNQRISELNAMGDQKSSAEFKCMKQRRNKLLLEKKNITVKEAVEAKRVEKVMKKTRIASMIRVKNKNQSKGTEDHSSKYKKKDSNKKINKKV